MSRLRFKADSFLEKHGRDYTDLYNFSEKYLSKNDPILNSLVLNELCKVWHEAGAVIPLMRVSALESKLSEARRHIRKLIKQKTSR